MSTEAMSTMSTVEVARETGATYRQLDTWCRYGYIDRFDILPGSGSRRRWNATQIAQARRLAVAAWVTAPVNGGTPGWGLPEVLHRMWVLVERDPTGETWKP